MPSARCRMPQAAGWLRHSVFVVPVCPPNQADEGPAMANESAEIWIAVLHLTMLVIAGFSLVYPWKARQAGARSLVHLPLLLPPIWIAYEAIMPTSMNIRIDLFLLIPAFLASGMVYLINIIISKRSDHSSTA